MQPTVVNENISKPVTIIKCEIDDEYQGFRNDGVGDLSTTMTSGTYSAKNNTFGGNNETLDCIVCGDRATGMNLLAEREQ